MNNDVTTQNLPTTELTSEELDRGLRVHSLNERFATDGLTVNEMSELMRVSHWYHADMIRAVNQILRLQSEVRQLLIGEDEWEVMYNELLTDHRTAMNLLRRVTVDTVALDEVPCEEIAQFVVTQDEKEMV